MDILFQEHSLVTAFSHSIEREELLVTKYKYYIKELDDESLKNLMDEFKETSEQHLKLLKDKMIKLKIENI